MGGTYWKCHHRHRHFHYKILTAREVQVISCPVLLLPCTQRHVSMHAVADHIVLWKLIVYLSIALMLTRRKTLYDNFKLASRRAKKGSYFGHKFSEKTKSHWLASVFYLADDVTRRGWRLRHHSFNDILAHWEANRYCRVMLWASLSNSCDNILVMYREQAIRAVYDSSDTYHFSRLFA